MIDDTALSKLRPLVEAELRAGNVPGAVIAVTHDANQVAHLVIGSDADGQELTADSIFPVASVTKLATALAVLRLVEQNELELDDPLSYYVPTAEAAQPEVTIRSLLCHTSGLPAELANDAAPYATGLDWPTLGHACIATPLEVPANTRVEYSNVGYGLLALVVEHLTHQDFSAALESLVLQPLGIEAWLGVEPPRTPVRLADTRGKHVGTALEPFNSAFWRSLAFPWAGMLTTAAGALRLVCTFWHNHDGFLQPTTRAEAIRNQVGELRCTMFNKAVWDPCAWGLGPELRATKTPHWAPPTAHPDSFGHAGASGCLVWADPSAKVAWAMLGARTAESGWLLRRGAAIGAAILEH